MKTFKQHIKEGSDKTAAAVGSQTTNSVEDGSIGVHNIHDPDVLKRVNAFVGSISECEYLKPQFAVDKLREKLQRIGLDIGDVDIKDFEEDVMGEKAPNTADAMKRYKSGKAGFTDKAHLKAKGLIPRADGTKQKSDKYK